MYYLILLFLILAVIKVQLTKDKTKQAKLSFGLFMITAFIIVYLS